MPLSWNEIRNRAHEFSRKWEGEESERAEAQSFWNDFFAVFGIERKRVAVFEKQVQITRAGEKLKHGRIDAFWKGMLLIEHKSRGQDLSRAFAQAADYFDGLAERDLPRYILVSDFERFHLYDLEEGTDFAFRLADLHKRIKHFAFIAGYRTQVIRPQNPVNIKAAEHMGRLHDRLKASGYAGHPLEVLLVRLLFCLFADDTGIFQPAGSFRIWLEERTAADGADLGAQLAQFFQALNTLESERSKNLDEQLAAFPYVNGKLFEETLPIASFDAAMRDALLDCCALDWSAISPAIFGALFQSIMDDKARRNLGAHYTSEENILKLIGPLFLDDLRAEFQRVRNNKNKLFEFHKKLRTLSFFDPACGCGNFLVIAYRELRALELDVLRAVHQGPGSRFIDIHQEIQVNVDQFYGIEIEEFPAQIAQVALWLMDHQMNLRVSEEFGMYFARIPLKTTPHIHHGNALTLDWNNVLSAEQASYVFGNPPFVGAKFMSDVQREEARRVFEGIEGGGLLDFVAAWYVKAAHYLHPSPASGRGAGGEGRGAGGEGRGAGGEGRGAGGEGVRASEYLTPRHPTSLPPNKLAFARQLRQSQTDVEALMWHLLRNRALKNAKFRRQHPLGKYILDFYCDECKLAVEIDGSQHGEQYNYDAQRDAWLAKQGITVLRFWNNQVMAETEAVLETIWAALPEPFPSPSASLPPLPPAGEGLGVRESVEAQRPQRTLAREGRKTRCAFVSTNSITQGEQVGVLWGWLLSKGMHIHFAHRTFQWSNEAKGMAAVHCVIIGFGAFDVDKKTIYEYEDIRGEAHAVNVSNINPYLVDAPDVVLTRRSTPICNVPEIGIGNKPIDDGNYLFTVEEKNEFLKREPKAAKYFRRWLGADEFLNGYERWCLWLGDCPPNELRQMPEAMARVEAVKRSRLASKSAPTRKLAETPTRFHVENMPTDAYMVIPEVSSERRKYIPFGFLSPDTLASNKLRLLPHADLYHFGVLSSEMHMAWTRYTCGRLESRYQYSIHIVYNNFPWPDLPSPLTPSPSPARGRGELLREKIEAAAQAVLDARAQFIPPSPASGRGAGGEGERGCNAPSATLADLYDPLTMPPALVKAHQKLDAAVDAAYGKKSFKNDAERVAFLFDLYQKYTSLLPGAAKPKRAPKPRRPSPSNRYVKNEE